MFLPQSIGLLAIFVDLCLMDKVETQWRELVRSLEEKFNGKVDISSLLFLIGVQELGCGFRKFSKDQKIDLIHIAICKLSEKYGYYKYTGKDEEGWPLWERVKKLPVMNSVEQEIWMKKLILEYFGKVTDFL